MHTKRCACCGQRFQPRTQTPHQTYCSDPRCQTARRRKWQEEKLKSDSDYRDNQARAQQAWCSRNPDYWSDYRSTHPQYAQENRQKQRARNVRAKNLRIAKMDASNPIFPMAPGVYRMNSVVESGIAKMDAWMVEIRVISRVSANPP
jgi:hypothetical protein